ncbi:MAG: hypothetical protein U0T84_02000 [Chitinophagales bacterium]
MEPELKKDTPEPFQQAKMVNWYEPRMLLDAGLKAAISGTFGNYADRREMEAALDKHQDPNFWSKLKNDYAAGDAIWFDIVGDTGDGFNSTFTIARAVGAPELELSCRDGSHRTTTQRGRILVFGGDQVYPFPTWEEYENRFRQPYAMAADPSTVYSEQDRPHLYAIPGNHDWYDGLGNFIKLFCQQRSIGIWKTRQHRSYFAIPLPGNYWLWATDIQLNSDIDKPQLDYFKQVRQQMETGAKIILLTAEPAWVYSNIRKEDRSYQRLQFFIEKYIVNNTDGKNFQLATTLTGDLHHYSRYSIPDTEGTATDDPSVMAHQYFTAGGGGAFLHLTHNLPKWLYGLRGHKNKLQCRFPDKKESKQLLLDTWWFPFRNKAFTAVLGAVHLLLFWLMAQWSGEVEQVKSFFDGLLWLMSVLVNPLVILLTIGIGLGFYVFADTNVRSKWAKTVGVAHALLQFILLWAVIGGNSVMWWICNHSWQRILSSIGMAIGGSVLSATVMGAYLYLSNLLFGMHINEASSALACADYKNFLRLHIQDGVLTVYPVGIAQVPKQWKQEADQQGSYTFTPTTVPHYFLIEPPVQIKL